MGALSTLKCNTLGRLSPCKEDLKWCSVLGGTGVMERKTGLRNYLDVFRSGRSR